MWVPGLRQLVSVNTNTCGRITGEIFRDFHGSCVDSFSGESRWDCLQSRSLGTMAIPAEWLILLAHAFLPCSESCIHLNFSALLASGWGETEVVLLCCVQKAREAGQSLCSAFPSEGNFLAGEFSPGAE